MFYKLYPFKALIIQLMAILNPVLDWMLRAGQIVIMLVTV